MQNRLPISRKRKREPMRRSEEEGQVIINLIITSSPAVYALEDVFIDRIGLVRAHSDDTGERAVSKSSSVVSGHGNDVATAGVI